MVDDICKMIPFNPAQQISLSEFIENETNKKKLLLMI